MIQKSNKSNRETRSNSLKNKGTKNNFQKSTRRNPLQNGVQMDEGGFKQFLEAVPDGLIIVNTQGKIRFINKQIEGMFGYQPEEMLGKPIELLIPRRFSNHKKHRDSYLNNLHRRLMGSGLELFAARKDGTEFETEISLSPLEIEGETYIIAAIRDVTLQKLAEKQLTQSLKHHQQTLDNMLEGIQIIDFDWRFIYVNKVATKFSQHKPEEILRRTIMEVYPGIENTEVFAVLRRCMDERIPHQMENRYENPNGTTSWVELSIQPVPEGIFILSIDITERRQTEAALAKSEKHFRALVEKSMEEVSIVGADGTLLFESPSTRQPLGYPPGSFVGQNIFALFHPDEQVGAIKLLEDVFRQPGTHQEAVFRLRHQDGSWRWMEGIVTNMLDEPAVQGIVINYRDVTERKQAEEEIRIRTEELRTLYELSRALADADDLDEILSEVNRHAVESVHTTFARIALVEDDHLVMRAAYPVRALDHDLRVGKREPLVMLPYCQHVLDQHKSIILLSNNQEATSHERAALLLDFAQSVCLIPLRVGRRGLGSKQALGLLMLGETRSEGREAFTPAKILLSESIGDQAASAIRRMLLHEQTERRLQHLTALREIDQSIASSSGLRISLGIVLSQVVEQLSVDAAAVWLFNSASNMLEYSAGQGFHSKAYEQRKLLQLGEGYAGRAALEHHTVHISNLAAQEDNPQFIRALAGESFVSYYGVPLVVKGSIKGVLEVFHRVPLKSDEEWLGFLETLAGQAAIAIDNATLFDDLQRSNADLIVAYDTTLEGWSAALDLRDKETEGHTQRVTRLTLKLAESMGFDQQQLIQVRRGALLHDIGKMGVPDRILLKPDKLTDEEWEIMRMHPVYAYQLLKEIAYLHHALDIPYCHHEKWDGTGYPRGMKGKEIPLAARIFAVVDIYDALTSDRPYRQGWTREKTLNHIHELSGTHLDPQVVDTFLKMIDKDD